MVACQKDVIKHSGRTVSPREVQEIVDGVRGIRYSAAVGIDTGSLAGEQLFIFAETRLSPEKAAGEEGAAQSREIVNAVRERLGFRPGRVYLVARSHFKIRSKHQRTMATRQNAR